MKANNFTKKLLTALIAFTLLTATVSAKPPARYSTHPLSVKYYGMQNDYLVFKITVRTNKLKKPELFVDESTSGSLYWKKLSANTRTEWIKIKKGDNLNLRFELVGPNKTYYRIFTTNTLLVPQLTVAENKDLAAVT